MYVCLSECTVQASPHVLDLRIFCFLLQPSFCDQIILLLSLNKRTINKFTPSLSWESLVRFIISHCYLPILLPVLVMFYIIHSPWVSITIILMGSTLYSHYYLAIVMYFLLRQQISGLGLSADNPVSGRVVKFTVRCTSSLFSQCWNGFQTRFGSQRAVGAVCRVWVKSVRICSPRPCVWVPGTRAPPPSTFGSLDGIRLGFMCDWCDILVRDLRRKARGNGACNVWCEGMWRWPGNASDHLATSLQHSRGSSTSPAGLRHLLLPIYSSPRHLSFSMNGFTV